jgi:hypothetical protein
MKKLMIFAFLIAILALNCTTEEEPLVCHLYGRVIHDTTGVNDIKLKIWDINPYNVDQMRSRETTTRDENSTPGFFEMDSVCYGTTRRQGSIVSVVVDSTDNPGWPSQIWQPDIYGDIDTIILYIND